MSETSNKYGQVIRLRVTDELKSSIEAEADKQGVSVSELIRERFRNPSESEVKPVIKDITRTCVKVTEQRYNSLVEEATKCDLSVTELLEKKLEGSKTKGEMPAILTELYDGLEWANLLSAEENCKNLVKAIDDGKITFTNQGVELNVEMPIDVSRFIEACEAKGIDPQKRLDEQAEWVKRERVNKP